MIKKFLQQFLPDRVFNWIRLRWHNFRNRNYAGLSNKEVFEQVYRQGTWNKVTPTDSHYNSGSGSHDNNLVVPYVSAIHEFISTLPHKPNVVDLGCGDFAVGSKIRNQCADYIACDVVEPLILHNRKLYHELDVDFRVLDLAFDPLPVGDLLFVRQVLQHLNNRDIRQFLSKLPGQFRYAIVSETLPKNDFVPNLEKPLGPNTRLRVQGGVVLTHRPFDLEVRRQTLICEVEDSKSIIRTTLFEF